VERPNLRLLDSYYHSTGAVKNIELKLSTVIPDVPGGYVVTDHEEKYSLNVLIVPIDSEQPCGPRSNLDLVNHIWYTYKFSFYKYATLILPFLERVGYIKDPRTESDGWLSPACSYCRRVFEYLYKDMEECASPELYHCTVCVTQLMTLKGPASDAAFRYVLNLEAFRMDPRVPYDIFSEVATCGRVSEDQIFPHVLPCIMNACYCKEA